MFQHEACQQARASGGQLHANAAAILGVAPPSHETALLAAVDQPNGALVPDLELFSDLGDGRTELRESLTKSSS